MHAELEVLTGPHTGRRHVLVAAGETRVGRVHGAASVAVPDPLLAPHHFTLTGAAGGFALRDASAALALHRACASECFGESLRNERCPQGFCRQHDMSGKLGVYVNGARVEEHAAVLKPADVIVAGTTAFRLNVAAEPPAEAPPPAEPPLLTAEEQARALAYLNQHSMPLYAIVDAARDPAVLAMLQTHDALYYSLYDGAEGEALAEVAPYLARLEPGSRLLNTFLAEGWGRAWGVLLYCPEDFKAVRRHLRHFLMVDTEAGKPMYFRFYDPRVLRAFLPTCDAGQLRELFGPIATFVVEQDKPTAAWLFAQEAGKLQRGVKDFERAD
jgi:pSer/pThr/pTyr-binding forkhead associated (FHA) protein